MFGIMLSLLLATNAFGNSEIPTRPFPKPPDGLPVAWECKIEGAIMGPGPCVPEATISYCYVVDRVFMDYYKPYKIDQYEVCLPYLRKELNLNETGEPTPEE